MISNDVNPVDRPDAARTLGAPSKAPGQPPVDAAVIKTFRDQVVALGVVWIIFGVLAAGLVLLIRGNPDLASMLGGAQTGLLILIAVMGIVWFVLGVLTCLKQMVAVYVGLALSYLSLVGQVLNFNVIAAVILVLIILQAHRVIRLAKQLRPADVPAM